MKVNIPDFTMFQMVSITVVVFVLSSITISIIKHNIFSDLYNRKLPRFASINAIVKKCDIIVDTWTTKSKRSNSIVSLPVFRPLYHVEYTIDGKKYNKEIMTSLEQSFKSFREAHKFLCTLIGSNNVNVISYDSHEWLDEDILYIVHKEYVSSFPTSPLFKLEMHLNPDNPDQISLGDKKNIHIFESVFLSIVTGLFFSLFWFAPNHSIATKTILSITILCISFFSGLNLNSWLVKLPKKTTKYSFTIGSTIKIEPLIGYISEGLKEELKL